MMRAQPSSGCCKHCCKHCCKLMSCNRCFCMRTPKPQDPLQLYQLCSLTDYVLPGIAYSMLSRSARHFIFSQWHKPRSKKHIHSESIHSASAPS